MRIVGIGVVVAVAALVSCAGWQECGEGERIRHEGEVYCVYPGHIPQSGFQCPQSKPEEYRVDELRICAREEGLRTSFLRDVLVEAGLIEEGDPLDLLPSMAGDGSCFDPPGDAPTTEQWLRGAESLVVGTVVSVSPRLEPAWNTVTYFDPPYVLKAEDCTGEITPALDVTLADLDVLYGDAPDELVVTFGTWIHQDWSPSPHWGDDGRLSWWPADVAGIVAGQRLGAKIHRDPVWNLTGPAYRLLFLVDEGGIVRFQNEGGGHCGPVIPDGLHGEPLEVMRAAFSSVVPEPLSWREEDAERRLHFIWAAYCRPAPTCESDDDCTDGRCVHPGHCSPFECYTDSECPSGSLCRDGLCDPYDDEFYEEE